MMRPTRESARLIRFWQQQNNGVLTVFPGNDSERIPFAVARVFTIVGVPAHGLRGNHAHRRCSQLVVCLTGSVKIFISDGAVTDTYRLTGDGLGLLIPPYLWNKLIFGGPQTALMVICDQPYDESDYIRDWDEYRAIVDSLPRPATRREEPVHGKASA